MTQVNGQYTVLHILRVIDQLSNTFDLERTVNPSVFVGAELHGVYTSPDGEHCLVGAICATMGVDLPLVHDDENMEPFYNTSMKGRFDPTAAKFMTMLQKKSDELIPWYYAIEAAIVGE